MSNENCTQNAIYKMFSSTFALRNLIKTAATTTTMKLNAADQWATRASAEIPRFVLGQAKSKNIKSPSQVVQHQKWSSVGNVQKSRRNGFTKMPSKIVKQCVSYKQSGRTLHLYLVSARYTFLNGLHYLGGNQSFWQRQTF